MLENQAMSKSSGTLPSDLPTNPFASVCFKTFGGEEICIPLTSTGPFIPVAPASVGPLHGSELRKALRRYRDAGGTRPKYMKAEVGRFCQMGLVSQIEARLLTELIDLVEAHDDGDERAVQKIQKLHWQFLDDGASGVAVMISGIALDSASNSNAAKGTATADVAGGIGGAAVGAGVGGAAGSVPGAAVGAIGGGLFGALAASFAHEVDSSN
jgi:hypothetical protein